MSPRTFPLRRFLNLLAGLAAAAITAVAFAPIAAARPLATIVAPNNGEQVQSPTAVVPVSSAGLPLWAILTIVAGTVLVAATTTLVTLTIARAHQRQAPRTA